MNYSCSLINLINKYHISNGKLRKLKRKGEGNTCVYSGFPNRPRYGVPSLFVKKVEWSSTVMPMQFRSQLQRFLQFTYPTNPKSYMLNNHSKPHIFESTWNRIFQGFRISSFHVIFLSKKFLFYGYLLPIPFNLDVLRNNDHNYLWRWKTPAFALDPWEKLTLIKSYSTLLT